MRNRLRLRCATRRRDDDVQVTFGPQVARRVLRYELDRLCDQAGKTHTQAGERLGMSRVGFTQLISGKNLPSRPALEVLMDFFGRRDRIPIRLKVDRLCTKLPRQCQPVTIEVHTQHAAALRAKQLNGHQTDETQADNSECFAEGRLRQADAMERDGT